MIQIARPFQKVNQSRIVGHVIILSFAVIFSLIGVGYLVTANTHAETPIPQTKLATPSTGWIISTTALGLLKSAGATSEFINSNFNNSASYVVETANNLSPLPNAVPVEDFSSYAEFAAQVNAHTLIPGIKGILYDNEAWSYTPPNEQADPVGYTEKAALLAHQNGLILISTPAVDLVTVLAPNATTNRYQTFENLDIIGGVAQYADVTEIQAQGAEGTSSYVPFVQAEANQARAANTSTKIFAGMGTAQSSEQISASQLYTYYKATSSLVQGYWMNIPEQSNFCPSCPPPQPQTVIQFLDEIKNN